MFRHGARDRFLSLFLIFGSLTARLRLLPVVVARLFVVLA
jgi:hypothetical protein